MVTANSTKLTIMAMVLLFCLGIETAPPATCALYLFISEELPEP